jgi:glycosyltransferase involved in cell wall biosynthesis
MRVALVSLGDPRDVKVWSGIPHSILVELESHAGHVEVIAPLHRWFKYMYAPERLLNRLRGKAFNIDRHPLALKSYARQIKRRLRGQAFDMIFSTSSVPIAALETSVPILYWTDAVLDEMIGYYPAFGTFTPRELAVGHRQEQAAIDRATYAVYASDWALESVSRRYERTDGKLVLAHFGANLSMQHDRSAVERMIENRLNRPLNLLFLGVDWERKGGPIAWEAVRQLNEQGIPAVLRVAGCDAPTAAFVENLGFISKATTEGKERLRELLTEATVLLFPTRAEAAGCVFAEASAFGLPIVSTDTGGVSNYVVSGVNGFMMPLSAGAEEYVASIRRLIENEELYRALSLGGFERYKSCLNWTASVKKLLQLVSAGNAE